MELERRLSARVKFRQGIDSTIMAINGDWRTDCVLIDISATGVLLSCKDTSRCENLDSFFLILSKDGRVFRRCKSIRASNGRIAANFIEPPLSDRKHHDLSRNST
jgi:hypothetical protein